MQRIGAEKPVVVQCLHDGDGGGVSGKENSRRQARKKIVNVEDIWTEGMKYRCSALVRRVRVKRVYGRQRTRSRRGDCSVVKREQLNLVTAIGEHGGFALDEGIFPTRMLVTIMSNQNFQGPALLYAVGS